jgi:hypothetical protein
MLERNPQALLLGRKPGREEAQEPVPGAAKP